MKFVTILTSLVLVLGLAGISQGATVGHWMDSLGTGHMWTDAGNWKDNILPDSSGEAAAIGAFSNNNVGPTLDAEVTIDYYRQEGTYANVTTTIASGGKLTVTNPGGDEGMGVGRAANPGHMVIEENGSVVTAFYALGWFASAGPISTLSLSGQLDVTSEAQYEGLKISPSSILTINPTGVLYWYGDHRDTGDGGDNKVATYIGTGQIAGTGLQYELGTGDYAGYTKVYVPEPATVALLGLGSLVLLRKRR